MPQRIQLRRTKGWRKPAGAVVVARPGKWGNPFGKREVAAERPELSAEEVQALVVERFRRDRHETGYPDDDEIRAALRGRDLACWCRPTQPCHADVLLEIANG